MLVILDQILSTLNRMVSKIFSILRLITKISH